MVLEMHPVFLHRGPILSVVGKSLPVVHIHLLAVIRTPSPCSFLDAMYPPPINQGKFSSTQSTLGSSPLSSCTPVCLLHEYSPTSFSFSIPSASLLLPSSCSSMSSLISSPCSTKKPPIYFMSSMEHEKTASNPRRICWFLLSINHTSFLEI